MKDKGLTKVFSSVLCLVLVLSMFVQTRTVALAVEEADFIYEINSSCIVDGDEEYEITYAVVKGYRGTETDITFPDTLGGYPIRNVNLNLDNDSDPQVTVVRLPASVKGFRLDSSTLTDVFWNVNDNAVGDEILQYHFGVKFHLADADVYSCKTEDGYFADIRKDYAKIYKYEGSKTAAKVPDTINGKSVKYVSSNTFQDNKKITSVEFPAGAVSVDSFSFSGCTKLKTVKLPSSVTSVSGTAFSDSAVTNVYFASTQANWIKAVSYDAMFGTGTELYTFGDIVLHFSDWTVKSVTENGFKASLYKTFAVIYGYTGKSNTMVVPAKISGKAVFQVESSTFSNKNATSITLSEGIKQASIYIYSHNNKSLVIKIPSTIVLLNLVKSNYVKQIQYNGTKAQWVRLMHSATKGDGVKYLKTLSNKTVSLKSVVNSVNGPKITWGKIDGADAYLVYRKNGSSWTLLGKSKTTSFTDKTAKSGKTYTYTVKAESAYKIDSYSGVEYSKYNKTGISIKFLSAPKISTVVSATNGLKVTWNKISGAKGYYVYRKTSNGWNRLGATSSTSFVDKTAKNNTAYTYTVRAYYGKTASSFYSSGKSGTYLKAPVISKLANTNTGITIQWNKVSGATVYTVYRKTTGGWTNLGNTKNLSFKDTTAKAGTTYTYTVRAKKTGVASSYYSDKKIKRLETPKLVKLTAQSGKNTLTFGKVEGASYYNIYRKTGNGEWEKLGKTDGLKYVDKTIKKGITYTYTVIAVSGSSKSTFNSTGLKVKAK